MKKPRQTDLDQTRSYSLSELCLLAELQVRTVRYYIQIGLVDRPIGERRAARYGPKHLEQLLAVKKWSAAGVSLERIRELLHGADEPVAPRPRHPGDIAICSHLYVADGLEVVVDAARAGLSPEQLRQFVTGVIEIHRQVTGAGQPTSDSPQLSEECQTQGGKDRLASKE